MVTDMEHYYKSLTYLPTSCTECSNEIAEGVEILTKTTQQGRKFETVWYCDDCNTFEDKIPKENVDKLWEM